MKTWKVQGADRNTGADRDLVVAARDEQHAVDVASRSGMVVSSARSLDGPAPSRPEPSLGLLRFASAGIMVIGGIGLIVGVVACIGGIASGEEQVLALGAISLATAFLWLGFAGLLEAVDQYVRRKW